MDPNLVPHDWPTIYARYNEALNWLGSLITDPAGLRYLVPTTQEEIRRGQEAGLARTERFLHALGDPQNRYHAVHVAGTGGKGSVSTMIGAILQASGVRSGLHTSPYVQVPNEKLVADGKMVAPSEFLKLVDEFRLQYESYARQHPDDKPKYGEAWVALTHLFFKQAGVEWAALETGMGGRFDPTNIVNTQVAVITNIDFDHVPQLGTTLPEIAWHKAGIIKPGKPTVTGETKPEALQVIEQEAKSKNSPLYVFGKDYSVSRIRHYLGNIIADVSTPFGTVADLYISLAGGYQALNAATAVTAAHILRDMYALPVDEDAIRRALGNIQIAGRMEIMQTKPLVMIDGAHNPQKMHAAATVLSLDYPHRKKCLVIGMLRTKDAETSLREILPGAAQLIATEPHVVGKPSFSAEEIAHLARGIKPTLDIQAEPDVQQALQLAISSVGKSGMVFVTGSIYMLGQVRDLWHPKEDLLRQLEQGV